MKKYVVNFTGDSKREREEVFYDFAEASESILNEIFRYKGFIKSIYRLSEGYTWYDLKLTDDTKLRFTVSAEDTKIYEIVYENSNGDEIVFNEYADVTIAAKDLERVNNIVPAVLREKRG